MMEHSGVIDMGSHWVFPVFFGLMTVVVGIMFVKSVFLSKKDNDKDDK